MILGIKTKYQTYFILIFCLLALFTYYQDAQAFSQSVYGNNPPSHAHGLDPSCSLSFPDNAVVGESVEISFLAEEYYWYFPSFLPLGVGPLTGDGNLAYSGIWSQPGDYFPPSLSWTYSTPGTYTITLVVENNPYHADPLNCSPLACGGGFLPLQGIGEPDSCVIAGQINVIAAPICGDGTIDIGEQCDGGDLNGESCFSRGYGGGTLGCGLSCQFDESACSSGGNPPVPTCASATPDNDVVPIGSIRRVYANGVNNATVVYFPTWSDAGGQDDLIWYPGINSGGGTWYADINVGSHGTGPMRTHVYLNNASYANVWCDAADFSTEISPTCVSATPDSDVVFPNSIRRVYANGVNNATVVYFPTWSDAGGQDDLIWYPGINSGGGTWYADINVGSHGTGPMRTHVYLNNASYANVWCDAADFSAYSLDPPTNFQLDCPLPGTTVYASWTPPAGYNTFYFRANPGIDNVTYPSAVDENSVVGNSFNFSSIPGQDYYSWVHTRHPVSGDASTHIGGNVTCLAPAPTLSVDLNANPATANAGQSIDLIMNVGGTAVGTVNYNLWWDCPSYIPDADPTYAEAAAVCGALTDNCAGTGNAIGYKCDGDMATSKTVPHTYTNQGNKRPVALVERNSVEATDDIAGGVTINASVPLVSNATVTVSNSNYCSTGVHATVSWVYFDPISAAQTAYEVQIDNDADPLSGQPEWESGVVLGDGTSAATSLCNTVNPITSPQTACRMTWNTNYAAWARVRNSFNEWSPWTRMSTYCNGASCNAVNNWTTAVHAFPQANFTYSPPNPTLGASVTFTDTSSFGTGSINRTWSWSFGGGSPGTATGQGPHNNTYSAVGSYPITLIVGDDVGSCTDQGSVNVLGQIPKWREVAPR